MLQYIIDHQQKSVHESRYMESRCHLDDSAPEDKEFVDSRLYVQLLENQQAYIPCPYCHQVPLIID